MNVCPEPQSGSEWIELRNPTGTAIDASGAFVDDVGGGSSPQVLGAGSVVPATGVLLVTLGSNKLNNSGSDQCRLLDASQLEIDAVSYQSAPTGQSWARLPNGTGAPTWEPTPTPGNMNQ